MKLNEVKRWGCDIGNVLIKNGSYKDILSIDNVEFIPDAIAGLTFLISKIGADNLWVISKASAEQQKLSLLVLEKFDIYNKTGLMKDHVRFCLERLDKAPIIKELALEGHIDDRGQVIESIQRFLPCTVWFSPEESDFYKWDCMIDPNVKLITCWKAFRADYEDLFAPIKTNNIIDIRLSKQTSGSEK